MTSELKYQYNGSTPQWLPGIGVVKPGQTFVSRYPLVGNPLIITSNQPATPVGELNGDDKVCAKCVRVKNKQSKKKD